MTESQQHQHQQQHHRATRSIEDVCRVARDEADGLRKEVCELRLRLEEVEEESKFHAAKANELTDILLVGSQSSSSTHKES